MTKDYEHHFPLVPLTSKTLKDHESFEVSNYRDFLISIEIKSGFTTTERKGKYVDSGESI